MSLVSRSFQSTREVVRTLRPSYPIYCLRPKALEAHTRRFISMFPGTVLYAIKCNPHPLVLDVLYRAGIRHFDTASLTEIAQVCETYEWAHAYFMHPVKARAVIQSAYYVYGVRHFVIDHEDELEKVIQETGGSDLTIIVRLRTPPVTKALYHLAAKFGAEPDHAAALMKVAAGRGLKVGLAFHVGSQCTNPAAYGKAMALVGEVIEKAGVEPVCLDVGGGFPAYYANSEVPPLEAFMGEIREGLKALALKPTVEILAEPGRALVAGSCSLIVQVQLRKGQQLYINDGIYGSLSEMNQVQIQVPVRLVRPEGGASQSSAEFILNGPTCDSLDVLPGTFALPEDTREGDWIELDQLGAYSNALATRFNGFHPETFVQVFDAAPADSGTPGEAPCVAAAS